MAKPLLQRLIKASKQLKLRRNKGFTLIELLVSIIVGALITVLLLGLVIDLAEANQRDSSRSQVQQDMQTAIDYIVQDLREAVFVYNGQCLAGGSSTLTTPGGGTTTVTCPGIVNHIPTALSTGGSTPVLAFWRTDSLPEGIAQFCRTNTNNALLDPNIENPMEAANLVGVCVAGKAYSLVIYSIDTSNPGDVWDGQARLTRYKLTRFRDNATGAADDRDGTDYVDPFREPSSTFQQWPEDADGNNLQAVRPTLAAGDNPVLLDFVSARFRTDAGEDIDPGCREFVDPPADPDVEGPRQITPLASTNPRPGFYACVRGGGLGSTTGQNQDILLSLVGNLTGKPGYSRGEGPQIAPIQTRVLVRGVIAK